MGRRSAPALPPREGEEDILSDSWVVVPRPAQSVEAVIDVEEESEHEEEQTVSVFITIYFNINHLKIRKDLFQLPFKLKLL